MDHSVCVEADVLHLLVFSSKYALKFDSDSEFLINPLQLSRRPDTRTSKGSGAEDFVLSSSVDM